MVASNEFREQPLEFLQTLSKVTWYSSTKNQDSNEEAKKKKEGQWVSGPQLC